MSHQYQQVFVPPNGFQDILKAFTREVLRDQPDNIYLYAAEYFKRMSLKSRGRESISNQSQRGPNLAVNNNQQQQQQQSLGERSNPKQKELKTEQIQKQLFEAIRESDMDKNGFLYVQLILRVGTIKYNWDDR